MRDRELGERWVPFSPSFSAMFERCRSTVRGLIASAAAISLVVLNSASRRRTLRSVSVSASILRRPFGRRAGLGMSRDEQTGELGTHEVPPGRDRFDTLDDLDRRVVLDDIAHDARVQR